MATRKPEAEAAAAAAKEAQAIRNLREKGMTEIFCEFPLAIAHALPNVPATHKCYRLHGHNYRVLLSISGPVDPVQEWLLDYDEIEKLWTERVHDKLDHRFINEVLPKTTSEFVAAWIAREMSVALLKTPCIVSKVEVWETERFGARWSLRA